MTFRPGLRHRNSIKKPRGTAKKIMQVAPCREDELDWLALESARGPQPQGPQIAWDLRQFGLGHKAGQ
jgi:hypothetical protein